jgi:hypothetical protein
VHWVVIDKIHWFRFDVHADFFSAMALQPIFEACSPRYWGFLITHVQTHGTTPVDEWSAHCRGLYLHRTSQHINTRDKHPCPQRDSNCDPKNQAAPDLCLCELITGLIYMNVMDAQGDPCTGTIFWSIVPPHLLYSASSPLPLTTQCILYNGISS